MFSWYDCSDGSELLTEEHIADTFDDEEIWTVQRSTGKGKPVETPVAKVVFAGKEALVTAASGRRSPDGTRPRTHEQVCPPPASGCRASPVDLR